MMLVSETFHPSINGLIKIFSNWSASLANKASVAAVLMPRAAKVLLDLDASSRPECNVLQKSAWPRETSSLTCGHPDPLGSSGKSSHMNNQLTCGWDSLIVNENEKLNDLTLEFSRIHLMEPAVHHPASSGSLRLEESESLSDDSWPPRSKHFRQRLVPAWTSDRRMKLVRP